MGILVKGEWQVEDRIQDEDGRLQHLPSQIRHWITPDGSCGPSGDGGFAAEAGRYHLYVSLACPFAHRNLILRALKRLENLVSVSVVNPYKHQLGWHFEPHEMSDEDPVNRLRYLHQVYSLSNPDYSGRASVPVLWDRRQGRIVSNDSGDIMRMFNHAFDHLGAAPGDYCPPDMIDEIDRLNDEIYEDVNIGVYKAGFAGSQAAYEDAFSRLFQCLDDLDRRLAGRRYLFGPRILETDWRLFTTLLRFDAVYHTHFKCNLRRIVDYPHLWPYTRDLFQVAGVAGTVDLHHIKQHYYGSHLELNPAALVPLGPEIDFSRPHDRASMS